MNDATATRSRSAATGGCAPPPEAGRVHKPPHPIFAILFLYVVAEAVLWGALAAVSETNARLAIAYAALCFCIVSATHWIESVEMRHVPAKLGLRRTSARWWGIALLVAAPGALTAAASAPAPQSGGAWRWLALLSLLLWGALWQEIFFRGFVFRRLMGRHGFLASAATAAFLLALAVLLERAAAAPALPAYSPVVALLELPLGFGLCQLFWMNGQSVWPGVVIRVALLAALWIARAVWPFALAATLLLLLGRVLFPRWQAPAST
ncbi:MAG: hypothetical protein JSW67_04045 [Candidatus Latescibacterota bacterium]|nr:MAG: hypothetical protein JSW67_04045 [Candidatus Latescibacterota bacterium]